MAFAAIVAGCCCDHMTVISTYQGIRSAGPSPPISTLQLSGVNAVASGSIIASMSLGCLRTQRVTLSPNMAKLSHRLLHRPGNDAANIRSSASAQRDIEEPGTVEQIRNIQVDQSTPHTIPLQRSKSKIQYKSSSIQ
jgi:ribosomal protein L28